MLIVLLVPKKFISCFIVNEFRQAVLLLQGGFFKENVCQYIDGLVECQCLQIFKNNFESVVQ